MIHQFGGFTVSKVGDGIGQVGVRTRKRLGGDRDRAYFAASMVEKEGSFQAGEVMRAEAGVGEDLAEVGWSVEVDSGDFQEIVVIKTLRMCLSLRRQDSTW